MSPVEAEMVVEADRWRYDRTGKQLAHFVAPLLNVQIPRKNRRVKADDLWKLLGEVGAGDPELEERRRRADELKRRMGLPSGPILVAIPGGKSSNRS
jgi:hypothetical protein